MVKTYNQMHRPSNWNFKKSNRHYHINLHYDPKVYESGFTDVMGHKTDRPWLLRVIVDWKEGHPTVYSLRYKTRENAKEMVHKLKDGTEVLG